MLILSIREISAYHFFESPQNDKVSFARDPVLAKLLLKSHQAVLYLVQHCQIVYLNDDDEVNLKYP